MTEKLIEVAVRTLRCLLTFREVKKRELMRQRQFEVTNLTSRSAGTKELCPNKIIDSIALEPKKTRLFWV